MSSIDKITKEAAYIESYLSTVMLVEELPKIKDKRLIKWMEKWSRYQKLNHHPLSTGTDDWDVQFLRWTLKGRVKVFVAHCKNVDNKRTRSVLKGIDSIYDKVWPHSATCGYIFARIWGWLQLELEKPGEQLPPTELEQIRQISRSLKDSGEKIREWVVDDFGGVQAIIDNKETHHVTSKTKT